MRKILLFALVLFSISTFGQTIIKGRVIDSETKDGLPFANVYLNNSNVGTSTNFDGSFEFSTAKTGSQTVVVQFVGYSSASFSQDLAGGELNLGDIALESVSIGLDEVEIIASVAKSRETPVAVSTISAKEIEQTMGNKELPEVLNVTPAVYATKTGGGVGDARINIRGFSQENVAVLINGVPVNDMENGWVYWSNWSGLGDAVSNIQVQRGLGASKLAISSIGGTMNIITKTTDAEKGGSFKQSITSYGNTKSTLSLSTGLMDNGYAISFVGSRTQGEGYIDETFVDAWSYFLSVAKDFKNHRLALTAIGAPQTHGQRDRTLSKDEYDKYGVQHNKDWGYLYGDRVNQRVNSYHKPQISLNDYWSINDNTTLSTSFYISKGTGYGSGPLGDYAPTNAVGQIDWTTAAEGNIANTDTLTYTAFNDDNHSSGDYVIIENQSMLDDLGDDNYSIGDTVVGGFSNTILRNSVNNHFWTGVLSSLNIELNENLAFIGGIDARYYKGEHYREVRDLMGGDFYYEGFKYATDGINPNYNSFAKVGDRIAYDNDGIVKYGGVFGQLEYKTKKLSAFAAGSYSGTGYQRIDRMTYHKQEDSDADNLGTHSEKVTANGYNVKLGANYNINDHHNVFFNTGYFSKAPFFRFAYAQFSNALVGDDLLNEKVTAFEVGYGYKGRLASVNINAYNTTWNDKSLLSNRVTADDGSQYSAFIKGLDANHKGIEVEFKTKPLRNLEFGGILSLGDWTWTNDVDAVVTDDATRDTLDVINLYAEGLKVGNAPQQQVGLLAKVFLTKDISVGATWVHNAKLFADFDVTERDDERLKGVQPYELPSFSYLDLNLGWRLNVSDLDCFFAINCQNALDTEYLAEADESFDEETIDGESVLVANSIDNGRIKGFWGWGRTWNFSFKVNF